MKYFLLLLSLTPLTSIKAAWLDTTGEVVRIINYAHTETILVQLSKDGPDIEKCTNKQTFAISSDVSQEGRARMYAMLLAAQASGRKVTIATDSSGDCEPWFSLQDVYRRVARIY